MQPAVAEVQACVYQESAHTESKWIGVVVESQQRRSVKSQASQDEHAAYLSHSTPESTNKGPTMHLELPQREQGMGSHPFTC